MWNARNRYVHDSLDETELSLREQLAELIVEKHHQGPDELPTHFHRLFNHTLLQIISKHIFEQKAWYRIISTARQTPTPTIFSVNGFPWQWLGLTTIPAEDD